MTTGILILMNLTYPNQKKGKSSKGEEEEEFKIEEDEEFKDMDLFNDSGFDDEEDDY